MTGLDLTWTSTGGEIDPHGCFVGETSGTYHVTATSDSIEGSAQIRVSDPGIHPGGNGIEDIDPVRPKVITDFSWKGTVPPQKWMNFYTKVLSSLVSTPGLTLEVRFDVSAGDASSELKIEATRSALRELGLSEEVEVRTE
jgi:hypothetical protein